MPTTTSQYEVESNEKDAGGLLDDRPLSTYAQLLMLPIVGATVAIAGAPAAGIVATALIPVLVFVALIDGSEGSPYSIIERIHYGG